MAIKESAFQRRLRKNLEANFPGCVIMKNDATYIQGIPDLTILFGKKWATLECKRSATARHQPNQDYYNGKLDAMGFSRFIFPENEAEVIGELKEWFAT